MLNTDFNDNGLSEKLKILTSGLGNIFNELLKEVGQQITEESKQSAPVKTGKLKKSINFILFDKTQAALTTKKSLKKRNVWYSNIREHGAFIQAKNKEYLTFKINGEWKKVKSVRTPAQPYAKPVWEEYFGSENSKGYSMLAQALLRKVEEGIN